MAEVDPRLGKRIRHLREKARLSQQQLADAIGINRSNLSQIETGARGPHVATQQRIAAALGVELFELYLFDDLDPDDVKRAMGGWYRDQRKRDSDPDAK